MIKRLIVDLEFNEVAVRSKGKPTAMIYSGSAELYWSAVDEEFWVRAISITRCGGEDFELELCVGAPLDSADDKIFQGLAEGILEDCKDEIDDLTGEYLDGLKQEAAELAAGGSRS